MDSEAEEIRRTMREQIKDSQWLVINGDSEQETPCSYTVGLRETFSHPEVVIAGLDFDEGKTVLNVVGSLIKEGFNYEAGLTYTGILQGFAAGFQEVPNGIIHARLPAVLGYYEEMVPVLQVFWPDKESLFPWDAGVNPEFAEAQRL